MFFGFVQFCFRLSSACYMYQNLTSPLVEYWRAQCFKVFIYVDDVCSTQAVSRTGIERTGLVINESMSRWLPSTRVQ
jgi:hypothetical protein